MAKLTVLAVGRTALESSNFSVPAFGAVVVAPISGDALPKPAEATMKIVLVGTAGQTVVADLHPEGPPVVLANPTGELITYKVRRPAYAAQINAYEQANGLVGVEVTGSV